MWCRARDGLSCARRAAVRAVQTMTRISDVPVLIVGGGAVGAVLSMELARRGIAYRCIDRLPGPARESRAIALHARTVELMDLVDPDLSRQFLERDLWCRGYVMHFLRAGERTEVRPGLDFTTVDSRYNCVLAHNQSETEAIVRAYTHSQFGTRTEYHTTFQELTQDDDGVTARVTHGDRDDDVELIRCQYLVAADGINSRVRRGLGLSVKGKDYRGSFFQNLDIHLHGFPDWTDYFHYCVGTDHFLMVAPLPGGHFRLLLSDRGEATDPALTPQQAFMRLLEQHFDGITMGEVVWHSKWETWVRLADTFSEGRVLLAGDSAHVHSTTGGQGMNCCMQDAFNLGWKLALVLAGHAAPSLLESYERERRPIAEQVIWAASSLHDIFMTHGKDIAERKQTMFAPGYTEKVVNYCSGVAYTYKDFVTAPAVPVTLDGPAVGDRAPDVDFEGGGTLFDRLRHPYFTLLTMADDSSPAPDLAPVLDRYGAVLHTERLPQSPALSRRYGASDGRMYLLRPDGYVAFKGRAVDAARLDAHLGHLLGREHA
jgi:2-polyprenyl-6-methoxyphenol hydroxylase-like FAD-dependent oxidoreductase